MRRRMRNGALFLFMLTQVGCGPCARPCQCPGPTPHCPHAVPLVRDGCQCCMVCARQAGEPCTDVHVCDSRRGLRCDFSASFPGGPGECVSLNSLGCELHGVRYREGQTFQPSCAQLCRCMGGGLSCVPLCPEEVQQPDDSCPHPQLLRQPGSCCPQWACDGLEDASSPETSAAGVARQSAPLPPQLPGVGQDAPCLDQTSNWGPCSHSCGPGLSTRTSYSAACHHQTHARLCQVRPCQAAQALPGRGTPLGPAECRSSYRSPVPVLLQHQGCHSARALRPVLCGLCSDGRCCSPRRTRSAQVLFRCARGRSLLLPVMLIESCVCHYNCPGTRHPTPVWV
ncbi:WNT1-inducible-signaling pathway protein 2-like [Denticeps clupeoides]|uniref:WNT1-inducible-signaling pathway protein 2-like n=1 Tax=Denticeps clupeoides TaxID=299321 RepID=UPI0010A51FE5|nr:WNT1-inducible-signaling pathway protein 2-like [Denticeps clupeoides]